MPLISKYSFASCATLYLWHVTEELEELMQGLTPDDIDVVAGVKSEARKREKAAWRSVVRRYISDKSIIYNELGAPTIDDGWISVSHSGDMVAVLHSKSGICGVDIERLNRKFGAVEHKYISNEEQQLPDVSNSLFRAILWCAKEALYKASGVQGLDLVRDIRVVECDIDNESLCGEIVGHQRVEMGCRTIGEYAIVYTK